MANKENVNIEVVEGTTEPRGLKKIFAGMKKPSKLAVAAAAIGGFILVRSILRKKKGTEVDDDFLEEDDVPEFTSDELETLDETEE